MPHKPDVHIFRLWIFNQISELSELCRLALEKMAELPKRICERLGDVQ